MNQISKQSVNFYDYLYKWDHDKKTILKNNIIIH